MIENRDNKSFAEFFAGIGLMRAGLERSGWNIKMANDIDPVKKKLYTNNFADEEDHFLLGDIHSLDAKLIPNISLATASFPCTDLSVAGARAGLDGAHSSAFWGFVRVLSEMGERKPSLILLENVVGFLTSNKGNDLKVALTALNELGYSVDPFIIDAANFVPQSRVRLFVVGKLTSKPHLNNLQIRQYFSPTKTRPSKLADFIFDHPEIDWDINYQLPDMPTLQASLSSIVEDLGDDDKSWWSKERVDYFIDQTSDKHLSKLNELREQEKYSYLTAFRRKRNGRSMAEIRFDGIAGCLRTPKGGSARQILLKVGYGRLQIRLVNPTECARLMGADDFLISGTSHELLFGFGDAVCVPVITWIADNYLGPELQHLTKNSQYRPIESYARPA